MKNKSVSVIILGGGSGTRIGGNTPKQFLKIKNKMIVEYTIEKFQHSQYIDDIIIVSIKTHIETFQNIVENNNFTKVKKIVEGGKTRQESVYNGLQHVCTKITLVHDGVRPFVNNENIEAVVKSIIENGSGILAVPVKDSVKICHKNQISQSLDRTTLWSMQTPQGFFTNVLKNAHENALSKNYIGTDESEIVALTGQKNFIVCGNYENIKITTPFDLKIGELFLS